MRLTTKIVIGIILSLLLLCLTLIIGYSFTDRKNYQGNYYSMQSIDIPQTDKTEVDLESYRVVVFMEQTNDKSRFSTWYSSQANGLFIQTATEKNKLVIPEALKNFVSTQTNEDTLTVKIKMDEFLELYGYKDEAFEKGTKSGSKESITISGLSIRLHTENVNVINKLRGIKTQIDNLETDSIKIYASGEIVIDACKANVIEPLSRQKLSVTNSSAKAINLDLDQVSNWSIKDCDIEEQNMTGSKRNHNITLTGTEKSKINWAPKNKDAELNIRIKGETATISYQIP